MIGWLLANGRRELFSANEKLIRHSLDGATGLWLDFGVHRK